MAYGHATHKRDDRKAERFVEFDKLLRRNAVYGIENADGVDLSGGCGRTRFLAGISRNWEAILHRLAQKNAHDTRHSHQNFFGMTPSLHSAPGAGAGFGYQFERALYWLAHSPAGFVVGIEVDDDVAVRGSDGSHLLEQDKHSIRATAEPFGNRSKDLWNTLAIWLDALETAEVTADCAVFLMVTNKVLPECLAQEIGRARTDEEVTACIGSLEAAGHAPPRLIESLVTRVLRAESRSALRSLILKCELVDGNQASAGPELRQKTIDRLQLPEWSAASCSSITDELLGWLHKTAMTAWRQQQPAWIPRDHFVNQLHAVLDLRKRQIARERAEHLIPVTDDKIGKERGRPFVRQLHLITDDDTVAESAIREFIRCNIEKGRLSAEGNITDEDWRGFETALRSRWDKIRTRVLRMKKDSQEADIGYEIFTETTEDYREKLAGTDTEQVYLTSGTYHRLADMLDVGWHPKFKELMREFQQREHDRHSF